MLHSIPPGVSPPSRPYFRTPLVVAYDNNNNNNNNTFTWSGPSGVLGCTGQRPGGPLYEVVHAKYP
jgi:hypothetical protein